jgi:L-malate glycosyltransferase
MKICILADARSIHTRRWVEEFSKNGHLVYLISKMPHNEDYPENAKIYLLRKSCGIYIPIVSFAMNLIYDVIQAKRIMKKIKPDILHCHYVTEYGIIGALTGFHPLITSVWGSDVLIEPYQSHISRYIAVYALNRSDIITTTAKFMKSYIIGNFNLAKDKIIRIPWGIDTNIFCKGYENKVIALKKQLNIKADSPIILSNRSMSDHYAIESIINEIPYVLKINSESIFIFLRGYGPISFENKMKNLAKNMNISRNIIFISEKINSDEMAVYLNLADIFISVPKTDQFASSIMEGMGCGAIPIVRNIDVYKQYLENGKNAFLIDPEKPQELANSIIYCINHGELKMEFYMLNRRIIEEEENWIKNAKKMEDIYNKAITWSKSQ